MQISAMTAAGAVLAGCCPSEPEIKEVQVTVETQVEVEKQKLVTVEPSMHKEAPMLADMGLPPAKDRLPENPLVVLPVSSVGQVGATWHRG
jgi:hypothetical protein